MPGDLLGGLPVGYLDGGPGGSGIEKKFVSVASAALLAGLFGKYLHLGLLVELRSHQRFCGLLGAEPCGSSWIQHRNYLRN